MDCSIFERHKKKFLLAILDFFVSYKNLYFSNNFMGFKWGKGVTKLKEMGFYV